MEAVSQLRQVVSEDVQEYARDSLEFARARVRKRGADPHGLSLDESAALNMYTKENLVRA